MRVTPLVAHVDYSSSDYTRVRLTVSLSQEAYRTVARYCDLRGFHHMRYYRETFDLALRDALIVAGLFNGVVEAEPLLGSVAERRQPGPDSAPAKPTLADDRIAVKAAAEAYRDRRQK